MQTNEVICILKEHKAIVKAQILVDPRYKLLHSYY